jgi:hypothetical protein
MHGDFFLFRTRHTAIGPWLVEKGAENEMFARFFCV